MGYGITMIWNAGMECVLLDALSHLPYATEPQAEVDHSFLDDAISRAQSDYAGPQGPKLDGFHFADREPCSVDEDVL